MLKNLHQLALISTIALITSCGKSIETPGDAKTTPDTVVASTNSPITTQTSDGVTIYGEPYFGDLDNTAPLILLFHQGGSNGRGEYAGIAKWLNNNGYRAIAWDQRSGGDTYGSENRTVKGLAEGTPASYCDAAADLSAALTHVLDHGFADKVIVWGSSYSAAMVFQLA